MDYSSLRERMVREQIAGRGIKDASVLDAFRKVERHKFIPEDARSSAYEDYPLLIGEGQTISQPYIVALMTELLELSGREKVLEIGTGSGYQTAILSCLASSVYTIERFQALYVKAQKLFDELGYANIKAKADDGTAGWKEHSPFDRIIITAASERVPLPLLEQLSVGGKLVAPLGEKFSQVLTVVENNGRTYEYKQICGCVFVPLVGKYACPAQ